MRQNLTAVSIAAILLVSSVAAGQGRGRGQSKTETQSSPAVSQPKSQVNVTVVFGKEDERIIREWVQNPQNLKGLPPGLAKKEQLPPGLMKQLVRNGKLPPGLQRKSQSLPPALEARLRPLPEGHSRVVIAGTVVLLHGTFILDLLANVF